LEREQFSNMICGGLFYCSIVFGRKEWSRFCHCQLKNIRGIFVTVPYAVCEAGIGTAGTVTFYEPEREHITVPNPV
jgi:hypothetical protein